MADYRTVAGWVIEKMKCSGMFHEWTRLELGNGDLCVRDFGAWRTPADVEDEEDYDWQEPDDATTEFLDRLCAEGDEQFPGRCFSYTPQEKNWLDIYFPEKELEREA